jgi:hypothetical protein
MKSVLIAAVSSAAVASALVTILFVSVNPSTEIGELRRGVPHRWLRFGRELGGGFGTFLWGKSNELERASTNCVVE